VKTGRSEFLLKKGYRCIGRNYRTRLGEIDIIASDGAVVCFIEVKTRSHEACGSGADSIIKYKQRRMVKAALQFLQSRNMLDAQCRFDVVSIDISQRKPRIELTKNAFVLDENDQVSDV